ncbi:MAG: zinc ribbon domain-containing protein [Xanthobacteraceae bacterium]|nr:zinc ribbon domain-containing protein [Xanthobacteraceae bacterium]
MSSTECSHCGEPLHEGARACGYCGAPVRTRWSMLAITAVLAAVCLAAVAAAILLLGGRSSTQDTAAVDQRGGDFAWLETAMKQCDDQAAKDAKGLHYLVTPLVDEPRDEPGWRRISINDIGNAILIGGEDMLAGLRRKALRISTEEYVFSARNETTKDVLTWKPSTGVRKFVVNDASGIQQFKVQFQSSDAARAINWGSTFERQPGNCYWVNAILRH